MERDGVSKKSHRALGPQIPELCRRKSIAASMYYGWSKDYLEAGNAAHAATSGEVKDLRHEVTALKEVVADLTLENCLLKKHERGWKDGACRIRED
jgi:transposase